MDMDYDTDSDVDFIPVKNSKNYPVKAFSCSCGKSFPSEVLLQRHKCLPTPVNKEYECRCGAAFSLRWIYVVQYEYIFNNVIHGQYVRSSWVAC